MKARLRRGGRWLSGFGVGCLVGYGGLRLALRPAPRGAEMGNWLAPTVVTHGGNSEDVAPWPAGPWFKTAEVPETSAERRRKFARLAEEVPRAQIEEALRGLQDLPPSAARRDATRRLLERWMQRAAKDAIAWLSIQPRGVARAEMWQAALVCWAGGDPVGALREAARELHGDRLLQTRQEIYRDWGAIDPCAALQSLEESGYGSGGVNLRSDLLADWSARDPAAALLWVGRHATAAEHDELLLRVVGGLGQADPQTAAACIDLLPSAEVAKQAATTLAARWAVEDLGAALMWVQSLTDERLRQTVQKALIPTWIDQDPASAARQLHLQALSPAQQAQLARRWMEVDPVQAQAWAGTLPPEQQAAVWTAMAAQTVRDDAAQALGLLAQIVPGPVRDQATLAVVEQWAERSPVAVAQWIGAQSDLVIRRQATLSLLARWIPLEPRAAGNWVLSLPDTGLRTEALARYQSSLAAAASKP